jgi:hypothetical protein
MSRITVPNVATATGATAEVYAQVKKATGGSPAARSAQTSSRRSTRRPAIPMRNWYKSRWPSR